MEHFSKTKYVAATVLFIALFFIFGVYVGDQNRPAIDKVLGISGKETAVETQTDFSPFWKVWNIINEKHPTASKTTDQDRVYGAISGLVGSLNDPYSVFLTPEEAKSFGDEIAGNFDGIAWKSA